MTRPARHFAPIDFRDRFPALDGIRALAVTAVFLRHYGGGSHGGHFLSAVNTVRSYGTLGVDLFFVLSGFLITGILYDTRHDSAFFKRFFLRRTVRIFPVFYLVVALLLILTPIMQYNLRPGLLLFLVYLGNFVGNHDPSYYTVFSGNHPTMRFNIGHFWSLCVEEQFYMLWPVVVWWVRDRIKLLRVCGAIVALAFALRWLIFLKAGPGLAEVWIVRTLPFRMDTLIIGAALALLLRGPNADLWQRRCRTLFIAFSAAALAIFLFAGVYDGFWVLVVSLPLVACASAGLIGSTLRAGSPAFRLFYRKPLRSLGKYSYGFYVYHVLFQWKWIVFLMVLMARIHSMLLAGIIILSLNFAVTFLVSKLSYDLFEVKFLRLKRHFEYDSEQLEHKHAFTTR